MMHVIPALLLAAALLVLQGCAESVEVQSCVETQAVGPGGDVDDPAIWIDRNDPANSTVIGTDKRAGLYVYDLSGRELQFVALGGANNVDIRPGFPFADGPAPLVAVTNRSDDTVTLLRFDEENRRVVREAVAKIQSDPGEIGVCLYRAADGAFHVGAAGEDAFRQWRLDARGGGGVSARLVRTLSFASATEGCVYDDALGRLYVAEEDVGIWRFPADPRGGPERVLVDGIREYGGFPSDVEGLAIHARGDGTGFLVASAQGNSTFRVYRREGGNAHLGNFHVGGCADGSVDAVSGTDGIEIASRPLRPDWPGGLFVVHDGENAGGDGKETSNNYKLVDWRKVERALGLTDGAPGRRQTGRER